MKQISFIAAAVFISITLSAQESKSFKIITGVRVNPLLIYDLKGNVNEKVLLHGELGALFNKKIYTSVGYTAAMNAIYNFNEYWFLGFDKKLPVSWVLAEEYNFNNKMIFIQTGPNIKLSNTGNVFVFLFTPVNQFNLGLKVGVFIPLNFVIKNK
ncbi:MAG: hypothetical protein GXO80_09435 [Chlorobi bacterium]|nr:hypothetical protein [Chlorobiota bacterium]